MTLQRRLLTLFAGTGIAAITGALFVLTYDDLHALALAGRASERAARAYPIMYDALIVIAVLSLVAARYARWWSRWTRWALLFLLVGGAAAASVQRALKGYGPLNDEALTGGVAAAPHVMLVIALLLWLAMFRQARAALSRRIRRERPEPSGPPVALRPGAEPPAPARPAAEPPAPPRPTEPPVPARPGAEPPEPRRSGEPDEPPERVVTHPVPDVQPVESEAVQTVPVDDLDADLAAWINDITPTPADSLDPLPAQLDPLPDPLQDPLPAQLDPLPAATAPEEPDRIKPSDEAAHETAHEVARAKAAEPNAATGNVDDRDADRDIDQDAGSASDDRSHRPQAGLPVDDRPSNGAPVRFPAVTWPEDVAAQSPPDPVQPDPAEDGIDSYSADDRAEDPDAGADSTREVECPPAGTLRSSPTPPRGFPVLPLHHRAERG